jgi:hypothetical protein
VFVLANLNQEQIRALQRFEYAEGLRVLALKEVRVEPDLLADDKVAVLHQMEHKLGCCLLAVRQRSETCQK